MARKKNRQPQRTSPPANGSVTTKEPSQIRAGTPAAPVTPAAAATAVTANPAPAAKTGTKPERSWVELAVVRASRLLGSLQVAIILLVLFTVCVLVGTLMEHYYSTKIAQELVYKAWWFVLLLLLLSVNIFFAAAKKWPWKWHQTGFIITHIGLLTMLAGGILNGVAGTDAQMQLIDTNDQQVQNLFARKFGKVSQTGNYCIYSDTAQIRVRENAKRNHQGLEGLAGMGGPHGAQSAGKWVEEDFEPGPLPWQAQEGVPHDPFLSVMTWLSHPIGRSFYATLPNNATLEVVDFLPHARRERFTEIKGGAGGFPAVKLQLRSLKMGGMPMEEWLAGNLDDRELDFGGGMPALIEFIGRCPMALIPEFLNPPDQAKLGKKGLLVVVDGANGKSTELSVDEAVARSVPVGNGQVSVKVTRYLSDWLDEKAPPTGPPADPAVEFELYEGAKKVGRFRAFARYTGVMLDLDGKRAVPAGGEGMPYFLFHAPDVRQGREHVRGVLQFAQGDDKNLYYRAFSFQDGSFLKEASGTVKRGDDEIAIWKKMEWKFRVLEHYQQASAEEAFTAAPVKPGKETDEDKIRYVPAVKCKLRVGAGGPNQEKEVWVAHQTARSVTVGGRSFTVEYTIKTKKLGFDIKLERAEQTVDPGTRAAASYSSYIQLFDKEQNIKGERKLITMNQPLEHRGYKFYQSTYQFLDTYDANGKPVSLSGFTVGSDPGLELKYIGSLMLGLGIFTMFYMKAYFFKPRGRAKAAPTTPAAQPA